MVFYQELDPAGRCVLDSLYPLVSRFQSLRINGIVVCPEGIELQSGVAHRCEFLGPLAKLFSRDTFVIPCVPVDSNTLPTAAPNQRAYRSAELIPNNATGSNVERGKSSC